MPYFTKQLSCPEIKKLLAKNFGQNSRVRRWDDSGGCRGPYSPAWEIWAIFQTLSLLLIFHKIYSGTI